MKNPKKSKAYQQTAIVKETLTQQVCNLLKAKIINGELVSGNRIWADDLAENMGVSIAPVKEALLILAGEGLINNIPRRGSVIRRFTFKEMHELYDVRRLLETEALEIMFRENRINDDFVAQLRDLNKRIGQLRKNGEFSDRNAAFELDWEFHQVFMQNSEQSLLTELYSRLNTQAQIIRYASWNIGPRGDKTFNEHDAIVVALERRDPEMAKQAIHGHLGSILHDFDRAIGGDETNVIHLSDEEEQLPSGRRKNKLAE